MIPGRTPLSDAWFLEQATLKEQNKILKRKLELAITALEAYVEDEGYWPKRLDFNLEDLL